MKIKAELIQASNNTVANVTIYTFRLTFPKKNALLDSLGLSKYFERWLTTTVLSTATAAEVLLFRAEMSINRRTYISLHEQVCEIMALSERVFKAVGNGGRISGNDMGLAMNLFGSRLQDVLKRYKPGESHQPHVGSGHEYVASETGWQFVN